MADQIEKRTKFVVTLKEPVRVGGGVGNKIVSLEAGNYTKQPGLSWYTHEVNPDGSPCGSKRITQSQAADLMKVGEIKSFELKL